MYSILNQFLYVQTTVADLDQGRSILFFVILIHKKIKDPDPGSNLIVVNLKVVNGRKTHF